MEVANSKFYMIALWFYFLLLLLVAGVTAKYVPEFQAVFSGFGTDLPILTQFVLKGAIFIWALPIIATLLLASFYRQKKANWGGLLVLVVLGVAWVSTAVLGLYLPVAESAEAALNESANKSFKSQPLAARTALRAAA